MVSLSVAAIAQSWGEEKKWFSQLLGLSPDALHVHASIIGMLLAAVLWRRRMDDIVPWLSVFVVEIANELLDLSAPANGKNTIHASLHDLVNTMFLPTVMLVCLRFTRRWRGA